MYMKAIAARQSCTTMSYAEEDTCTSCEEEDTCMSYDRWLHATPELQHKRPSIESKEP